MIRFVDISRAYFGCCEHEVPPSKLCAFLSTINDQFIVDSDGGHVFHSMDEVLALEGVGPRCAGLVPDGFFAPPVDWSNERSAAVAHLRERVTQVPTRLDPPGERTVEAVERLWAARATAPTLTPTLTPTAPFDINLPDLDPVYSTSIKALCAAYIAKGGQPVDRSEWRWPPVREPRGQRGGDLAAALKGRGAPRDTVTDATARTNYVPDPNAATDFDLKLPSNHPVAGVAEALRSAMKYVDGLRTAFPSSVAAPLDPLNIVFAKLDVVLWHLDKLAKDAVTTPAAFDDGTGDLTPRRYTVIPIVRGGCTLCTTDESGTVAMFTVDGPAWRSTRHLKLLADTYNAARGER